MEAAGEWLVICEVSEVEPGTMRRVEPPGLPSLAVYNVEGKLFVTVDRCTHAEACLTDGTLLDDVIECPFHGGAFDVRTGAAVNRPAKKALQTWEVDVRGNDVAIRVPTGERKESMPDAAMPETSAPE